MAGYHNFSKSNNAIDAEQSGRFPASIISKKTGLPTKFIKECLTSSEWHHSSKHFNVVDYYCLETIQEELETEEFQTNLDNWKKSQNKQPTIYDNCSVTYLEWSGTRKHPRATTITEFDCRVVDKGGDFVLITTKQGRIFRKGKKTNGFVVVSENKTIFDN